MKFKVLHDFKANGLFEAGNSHDSEKLGVDVETVERWYRQGWVQIDGYETAPDIDPKRTELAVKSTKHVSSIEVK